MNDERAPTIMELAPVSQAEPIPVEETTPAQRSGHIANIRESYMRAVTIDEVRAETGMTAAQVKAAVAAASYLKLDGALIDYA